MTSERSGPAVSNAAASVGRRVFISAPADADVSQLIGELARRGSEPYVLSDVALLGTDILRTIQEAITQANLVIIVLADASNSLNAAFEAGWAVALGKPLVVIAEPRAQVPADFADFLTVRARADDVPAIAFALDQAEGRTAGRTASAVATSKALGSRAEELLGRAADLLRATSPAALERAAVEILVEALNISGALPVEAARPDDRFDLAVWLDDLDAIAANPLLIELKRKFHPSAVEQALAALSATPNARVALIVYLDPSSATSVSMQAARYPVLVISLPDLLERMRTASFGEVIRDLRNRSAHGRSAQ